MARLAFVASLLLVIACNSAPAGASPSPRPTASVTQPTPTAQPTASPTVAAMPAVTPPPSTRSVDCDPYYGNCDKYTPRPVVTGVPSPAGLTVWISVSNGRLVDDKDMALYTFDNDAGNASTCYDSCAENWPPLLQTGLPSGNVGVTGTLDSFDRGDGTTQVRYNGHPLYYYSGDSAAGDTNGDGLGGVWHLAAP